MTDKQLAQLCADLYSAPSPACIGGIVYSVTDGAICCRGSQTADDWLQDFDAIPVWTPIGMVHSGFWSGMQALYATVKPLATQPLILTGHSLGGAHARLLAGLFALDGIPFELVTFAAPRPAWANLRRIVEKSGMKHRNYRFREDPVPMVAPFPYEPTEDYIVLDDGPGDPTNLDPLRDHSILNYLRCLPDVLSTATPSA